MPSAIANQQTPEIVPTTNRVRFPSLLQSLGPDKVLTAGCVRFACASWRIAGRLWRRARSSTLSLPLESPMCSLLFQ